MKNNLSGCMPLSPAELQQINGGFVVDILKNLSQDTSFPLSLRVQILQLGTKLEAYYGAEKNLLLRINYTLNQFNQFLELSL